MKVLRLRFSQKFRETTFFTDKPNFDDFTELSSVLVMCNYKFYFTGNTARALFDDPEFLSEITSVPLHVINGIKKVWIAIRTTNYMHSDMFHQFAQKVKQEWRSAIPWYPLCASCHKIVEHGHICIRNSNIPVGYLGEDALESFFHDFKVFR